MCVIGLSGVSVSTRVSAASASSIDHSPAQHFAGDGVHRVDAAQVHAAQRHMAHEAQRVVCAFALSGENAVGDDVDVVIRYAVGAEDRIIVSCTRKISAPFLSRMQPA